MRANLPEDAPRKPTDSPLLSEPSGRGSLDWFNDNTSHSGHEKNHLFVNNLGAGHGELYTDVSGVSGVNSPADARASVVWDYDRDGFSDLATINANEPKLQLWRNRYAELATDTETRARFVALRFEGSNRTSSPKPGASALDGYGALVIAETGGLSLRREHRAGEGFAAQNSGTMLLGLGAHEEIEKLTVRWPSGRMTTLEGVPTGSLVTVREGAEASIEPYLREEKESDDERLEVAGRTARSRLVLYTTMTTTCASCRAELPELEHLRESFGADELLMVGLPMDADDSPEALASWARRFHPAYELRLDFSEAEREATRELVLRELRLEATPATIVTDREGEVLSVRLGAPTVSELRKLLADD